MVKNNLNDYISNPTLHVKFFKRLGRNMLCGPHTPFNSQHYFAGNNYYVDGELALCGNGFHVPLNDYHSIQQWYDKGTVPYLVEMRGDRVSGYAKAAYRSMEIIGRISFLDMAKIVKEIKNGTDAETVLNKYRTKIRTRHYFRTHKFKLFKFWE